MFDLVCVAKSKDTSKDLQMMSDEFDDFKRNLPENKSCAKVLHFFILKPFIESDIMSDDPKANERSVMICLIVQQIHSLSFLELF